MLKMADDADGNFFKLEKLLAIAGGFEGSVDDHREENSRVRNA